MNILFSSDENYARHMGVAMVSIMQHNGDVEKIRFFVINNRILSSTIEKLESLVQGYKNAEIFFIPFESYEKKLHLNLAWPISLSSYARLFVGEMLPDKVEKVLYLDCDIVICGSIGALWNTNLNGKCLGAIQDMVPSQTKASVGLLPEDPYFNALQVKYGYAVTCHKAQGGQWQRVFVDQGFVTEDMFGPDYFRWLYTAITRATETVYLVNWPKEELDEVSRCLVENK